LKGGPERRVPKGVPEGGSRRMVPKEGSKGVSVGSKGLLGGLD